MKQFLGRKSRFKIGSNGRLNAGGYLWRDEFTTPRAAGEINTTSMEPGPGTRTTVNTESCLSIIPNFGSSLYTHSGVTTTTGTHRCSFADSYSWIDFPTGGDFAPYAGSGKIVILYDSAGVPAWGYIGAAGEGETLGADLLAGWDFTSGWEIVASSIIDNNSFSTVSAGGVEISPFFLAGRLYKKSFEKTTTASSVGFFSRNSSGSYVENTSHTYVVGDSVYFSAYIRNASAGTTDVTTLGVKQVLTPAATGAWVYRDAALTTNGWHIPTAFNRNAASYTFAVYEPASGGKLFFQGGKSSAAYGDPGLWRTEAITRVPGYIAAWKINPVDATKIIEAGFSNAKTGALVGNSLRISSDTLLPYDGATAGPNVLVPLDNTDLTVAIILAATGAFAFGKLGAGYFKYLWRMPSNNTSALYAGVSGNTLAGAIDFLRSPNTRWLPTPLLSDSFTAADATSNDGRTSDGLGHQETTGLGSGGLATWVGASGAISSNRLVITPSLGSELLTDGDMETGDPPTGWTADLTFTPTLSASADAHSGSQSLKIARNGSNIFRANQSTGLSAGAWFIATGYIKNVTSSLCYIGSAPAMSTYALSNSSSWAQLSYSSRVTAAGHSLYIQAYSTGADGVYGLFDNVSCKPLTLSTCINASLFTTADITIETSFQMVAGTQAGLILGLNSTSDPKYFILAYHDGAGNIKIEISENGTYTTKATVATTAGSDYVLKVRRDGVQVWVWYNNVLIGSVITLSAGENTNLRGGYAGLFSTYEGNSFPYCHVYPTGTNNEYSILGRLIGA